MKTQHPHALLIGINHYPALPGKDLQGCVNDAQAVAALLRTRFGFPEKNIALLLDAAATRAGILAALDQLVRRAKPGEQVVIFYAGHGSKVQTAAGWSRSLVAHDSGRGVHPNRDVLDFELEAVVRRLQAITPYVTLLLDCGHDLGVRTWDRFATRSRVVEPDGRTGGGDLQNARRIEDFQGVWWTACPADGESGEGRAVERAERVGKLLKVHGAFTQALCATLERHSGPVAWRTVEREVAHRVSLRNDQRPQLRGRRDLQVVGTEQPVPQVARVEAVKAGRVTLRGGQANGVAPGTRWTLRDPRGVASAIFTVDQVEALWAHGPAPKQVKAGWSAELLDFTLPPTQGLHSLENPFSDEALQAGVQLDVWGQGVTDWGVPYYLLDQTDADLRIRNTTQHPVYLSLLQLGGDGTHHLLLPSAEHAGGLRLEPGGHLSVATYLRQDPRFVGPEGGLVLERFGLGEIELRLLVTWTPVDLGFLHAPDTTPPPDGHPLAQVVHLLATGQGSRVLAPVAPQARWAIIERTLSIWKDRPAGGQIDPGGSGRVLFYHLVAGTQVWGEVGVTAPIMSSGGLPPDVGYWKKPAALLPANFQLVPYEEVSQTEAPQRLSNGFNSTLTSPPFETEARTLAAPTGILRRWRILQGTTLLGYLAQTTSALHWFGLVDALRLPEGTLSFVAITALPTSGVYRHATDLPVTV